MHLDLVHIANAQNVDALIVKVNKAIINPAIGFIFALALALFIFGIVEFLINKNSESGRTTGKQHAIWGIIGMSIMIGAFGIVNLIIGTLS